MALHLDLAGMQIYGARDYQEDAFLITNLNDSEVPCTLLIVADGMGGHAAGNVASNMVVQAFNKHITEHYPGAVDELLRQSISQANNALRETIAETPALEGMGCTIVALLIDDNKMWWASVGDSHVYIIRDRALLKKNKDHSYGGYLDRMEALGEHIEIDPSLSRNMLTSAITGHDVNEIDVPSEPEILQHGDKIILCSDGMDTLSYGKIIQYGDWAESSKECVAALLKAVEDEQLPRQDNTTAIFVKVSDPNILAAKSGKSEPENKSDGEQTQQFAKISPAEHQVDEYDESGGIWKIVRVLIAALLVIAVLSGLGYYFFMQSPNQAIQIEEDEHLAEAESYEDDIAEIELDTAVDAPIADVPASVKPVPSVVPDKQKLALQDNLASGGKAPVMVIVPAGEFRMGGTKNANEYPRRMVKVRKFAISEKEISIDEYNLYARAKRVPRAKTNGLDGAKYPVTGVNWEDAYNYVQWLSQETGEHYRLPTEAEWEYAASTGKNSTFWWGYKMESGRAHCLLGCNVEFNTKIPVARGSFTKNAFGLYDTAGNVAEWVHECWHDNYKNAPAHSGVWEGGDCTKRVVRGGSFRSPEQSLRHANRKSQLAVRGAIDIGIRIARDIE